MRRNRLYSPALLLITALFAPGTWAQQLTFTPRLDIGYVDHTLESPSLPLPGGLLFPNQEFNTQHRVVRGGATLTYGRVYVDGYVQKSSKDEDYASFPAVGYRESLDGDRDEWSVSVGYQLLDRLSVFAGIRRSQIKADGSLGGEVDIETTGGHMGAAYAWPVNDRNVISINGALTHFDADFNMSTPVFALAADGSGYGYKIGLSWTTVVTDQIYLQASLDGYKYTYDDLEDRLIGELPGDVEEREIGARVGLSYSF